MSEVSDVRLLALECSGFSGSLALCRDGELIVEAAVPDGRRMAQGLAPLLADSLARVGWLPRDIHVVAVTVGPGSFTGLRIGIALAKAFAYAIRADVVAVDTLAVVAEQAPADVERLHVVVDAQRRQSFVGEFARAADSTWSAVSPPRIVDDAPWLESLPAGATLSGPGLTKFKAPLPAGVRVVDKSCWEPTAREVARVGWRAYRAGARSDVWRLLPQYYRPSAAEEKADEKADAAKDAAAS